MKKRTKAILLAASLALTLCACASGHGGDVSKFDAVAYVDGLIQENYLGHFDQTYLELVGITEEEARTTYQNGIRADLDYWIDAYGIEFPTNAFKKEAETLFREIYSHTSYRVISAARQDDGSYSVKVEVEPLDIILLCESNWDQTVKDFYEKYTPDDLHAMNAREYRKADQEWAKLILDLYQSKLEEMSHQEARSISVQLELNKDGYYAISNSDFSRLDALILDWSKAGRVQ